jgi:hypothetical protein
MASSTRWRCAIASLDKRAIADTKRLVDVASLPCDAEIKPEWDAFIAALGRPAGRKRIKALEAARSARKMAGFRCLRGRASASTLIPMSSRRIA